MKKSLLASLALGSILLAGCKAKAPTAATDTTSTATAENQGSMTDKMKAWAQAASVGGGLRCSFTSKTTTTPAEYVVKGKKLHMKGVTAVQTTPTTGETYTGEMIVDESFVYTWDTATKVGMKMAIPSEEELKKLAPSTPDFTSEESFKKFEDDGYSIDCTPGIVSDAEFVPPTDVEFKDYSAMMQDTMKKVQEKMSDDQKKQIEDAMKKYQQ